MTDNKKALILLKIITQQNYRDSKIKKELRRLGYLSDSGIVNPKGRRFIWDFFGGEI